MNTFIKKLREEDRHETLTPGERMHTRDRLTEYMQMDPVRIQSHTRHNTYARRNTQKGGSLFLNRNHMFAKIALMLILAVSGGTSVAAESALPGDLLYGVKIHVNENVRSAFAISTESKAQLQATLAERRAEEAHALQAKGELSSDTEADIRARIESHKEKALAGVATLQSNGEVSAATEIQLNVESTVNTANVLFDTAITVDMNSESSNAADSDKASTSSEKDVDTTAQGMDSTSEDSAQDTDDDSVIDVNINAQSDTSIDTSAVDLGVEGEGNVTVVL